MGNTDFSSLKKYATLCTIKNRQKSLPNIEGDYKFIDTTGSYLGFKKTKTSKPVLCSCSKDLLIKDLEIINEKVKKYDDNLDPIWYIGPLLPRDIFVSLNERMMFNFRFKGEININELINNINFEEKICRLCCVEDGIATELSFETFNDYKIFYKHQIINELNVYYDFSIGGGCRRVNYRVNLYNIYAEDNKIIEKYDTDYLYIEDIKKAIPIQCEYTKYSYEKFKDRFFISQDMIQNKKKNFDEVDQIMKERLGYKKSIGRWKREEEIYTICRKLFKNNSVIYQYRPGFLYNPITKGQQSIDIFIDGINIGIEHQGKQHYEPLRIFGGISAYRRTVELDKLKNELCKQNNIKLVYIKYDEKITSSLIKGRIEEALSRII